jgi:hypothetical protein
MGEGFVPPRELRITGTPRMNATRFDINLVLENENLFHFRVDLPTRDTPQVTNLSKDLSYSTVQGFVVRNSTENGKWQLEERNIPFFPFKVGHTADIVFVAGDSSCEVNVDGRPLCVFNYRLDSSKNIKSITIAGDILLQSVHLL